MATNMNILRKMIFTALFAALTAVGAWVAVPIGPAPIVLQNFFAMLTGLLLGKVWGLISIAIYLLAGALSLPVFSGGTGGLAKFMGPTGGFLLGYLPAVFVIGLLSEKLRTRGLNFLVALLVSATFGGFFVWKYVLYWGDIITKVRSAGIPNLTLNEYVTALSLFLIGVVAIALTVYLARGTRKSQRRQAFCDIFAMAVGALLLYACGVPWLKYNLGVTWAKALTYGFYPFIPGDMLKIAAAVPVALALRPLLGKR